MYLLQAAAGQAAPGSGMMMWLMLIMILVVMYFFMIRPQNKQRKELEKFRNELKKGDKVVTIGGIYGIISEIRENDVFMKVDGETKLRVSKNAIQKDFTPQQ